MKKYELRKNFTAVYSNIKAKLAFKTKNSEWVDTKDPVIILISIYSGFNENLDGYLKMNAFISTIKNHVKGRITLLLSDSAHVKTRSLLYNQNAKKAFEVSLQDAHALKAKFQGYFEGVDITFWHAYICQDENYEPSLKAIHNLYQKDVLFRDHVHADAEEAYTGRHSLHFPDKQLFIEKTVEDILEQCSCILVLAIKGYRYQFYHGKSYKSTEYVNHNILQENKVYWIHVFLAIENKTVLTG